MRPIGFSTGALAYADFRKGLAILRGTEVRAVELSALRESELLPLVGTIDTLDLSQYEYISLHAPSFFQREQESAIVDVLTTIAERGWPIIVHPDAIYDSSAWRSLGAAICLENMDNRKPIGRSAGELSGVFELLPEAQFCFDIGHARQFDSTMTEAYLLLTQFQSRLRQVHVSEVNTHSKHDVLSYASILGFREVAHLIPIDIPLILETPVNPEDLKAEMDRALEALPVCVAA
jgi:hypothetical protein